MREVSPNEGGGPAVPTRETLQWIIKTCEDSARLKRKIDNARGFAVNNRDCLAAHPPGGGRRWPIPASPPPVILAKIVSSTRDGTNYRWEYTVQRRRPTGTPYGFEDVGDPETAYNYTEAENGDGTNPVSGITLDSEVTGIEPCPDGQTVMCWRVNGVLFFEWQNVPVIECEE